MSKRVGGDQEVPVVPPPAKLSKIHPDYLSIDLPFYAKYTVTPAMVNSNNHIDLRLNSIYDPVVGATTNRQPQGRDRWASAFDFYRVLSCDVKLTLITNEVQGTLSRPSDDTYVWGYELIEQNGTVSNSVDVFMITKHAKRQMMTKASQVVSGATFSASSPHASTLTYHYMPQAWDFHVQEVGMEERWTPIGANPSNFHYMAIRIFGLDGQNLATDSWEMLVQMDYKVQFREVRASLIKTLDTVNASYPDAEGTADT
jgi:hypothetical protein